ncbi:MAG: hypothetical protein B6242_00135 [Anaerolineaceae bacterium 4572_78]|nr:MAG: hypothetical protein B6242_00135 [Anaerolineaceae bacterium 4572_78]
MICTNCGANLEPNTLRCNMCGVRMPGQKTQRTCFNCGMVVAQDATTCIMCQQPIDALPQRKNIGVDNVILGVSLIIIISIVYFLLQIQPSHTVPSKTRIIIALPPTATFSIPTSTYTPSITPTPRPTFTQTPTNTPIPSPTPSPTQIVHEVRSGDNLGIMANLYGVSVDEILAVNIHLSPQTILHIGDKIVIPSNYKSDDENAPEPVARRQTFTYTIQAGDTLLGISSEYGAALDEIKLLNPEINPDSLIVGQILIVPVSTPTPTATSTATPLPTFTPRPLLVQPMLLSPTNNTLIEGDDSTVFLSWTTSGLLTEDIFYVIHITDENGHLSTYPTKINLTYLFVSPMYQNLGNIDFYFPARPAKNA